MSYRQMLNNGKNMSIGHLNEGHRETLSSQYGSHFYLENSDDCWSMTFQQWPVNLAIFKAAQI